MPLPIHGSPILTQHHTSSTSPSSTAALSVSRPDAVKHLHPKHSHHTIVVSLPPAVTSRSVNAACLANRNEIFLDFSPTLGIAMASSKKFTAVSGRITPARSRVSIVQLRITSEGLAGVKKAPKEHHKLVASAGNESSETFTSDLRLGFIAQQIPVQHLRSDLAAMTVSPR